MLGRHAERARVDDLLARIRGGSSGALLVTGGPGIGKSALLEHLAARAEGMQVLRARGAETEVRLPFSALADLIRPVLGHLDRIPAAQRAALSAALALSPARPGDVATVSAATSSLLAAAADERPLCLLVDDVPWTDG
jgi:predicted ATPase